MTDARLHPTFLTNVKIDGLSDEAFRVFVNSIVHAAAQETDGHISRRSLRLLHPEADLRACAAALVTARLWEPREDGWFVHDFLHYQTPREQLVRARANDRLRKARERERKAARSNPSMPDSLPIPTVTTSDVTVDTAGQDSDRTGQRQAKEAKANLWNDTTTAPTCEGCGNPMPVDVARREQWTHHPTCDPHLVALGLQRKDTA